MFWSPVPWLLSLTRRARRCASATCWPILVLFFVPALQIRADDFPIPLVLYSSLSMSNWDDLQLMNSTAGGAGSLTSAEYQATSFGFDLSCDIYDYFTVTAGFRITGPSSAPFAATGLDGQSTSQSPLTQLEFGGVFKYPFWYHRLFMMAPRLGLDWMRYTAGAIDGLTPNADGQSLTSPLYLIMGGEISWQFADRQFLRLALDLGLGLNGRLSDSYYAGLNDGSTYFGCNDIMTRAALGYGYAF